MQKLKVSAVSYLNTSPFVEGIEQSGFINQIELFLDIPSQCAAKLLDGRVDVGLVPVAVIPVLKESHILTHYCIGATGPVRSVLLYSQVPLNEITHILLDNQSRTSVALVKILAEKLWKISPAYTLAMDGYEQKIVGTTAGVVIGDRTFFLNDRFTYAYDLAEGWQTLTGLPFVFACWVSNKALDPDMEQHFNKALAVGLTRIDSVTARLKNRFPPDARLEEYLTTNISYDLDASKRKGLKLFLDFLKEKQDQDV
ncbi:MAG: menaquinone biosynthetic enzyme MqnA/MqnD family protein [Bacteroidia bacterium]